MAGFYRAAFNHELLELHETFAIHARGEVWRDDARTQDVRPKTQDCRQGCAERNVAEWCGFYRAVEPEPRPYQRHIYAMRKCGDIVLGLGSWVLCAGCPMPRSEDGRGVAAGARWWRCALAR